MKVPVITIDGTSGCGKGTLAHHLAKALGWNYLDSGALYRIAGWAALQQSLEPENTQTFGDFVASLTIEFKPSAQADGGFLAYCNGSDVSQAIRSEQCSQMASKVSALTVVREALWQQQLDFRQLPGLVTDGRDMGTVVFPDADLKLFLTASAEERAKRRYLQLSEKGETVNLDDILRELIERDQRDMNRSSSPLKPAEDALVIDTSKLSIEQVFTVATEQLKEKQLIS